jgi:hypothetical protein
LVAGFRSHGENAFERGPERMTGFPHVAELEFGMVVRSAPREAGVDAQACRSHCQGSCADGKIVSGEGEVDTVWGAHDNGPRSARNLDLRTLMDPEDQRKFAKLYISAFLDASLKGGKRYLPMFRDYRVAGGWLPKTMYTTRFEESTFRPVATFEEDIDVTTGTENGVKLEGDSVATWKESRLTLRTANSPAEGSSQYNNAVTIGWNNRIAGDDTTKMVAAFASAGGTQFGPVEPIGEGGRSG